MRELRERAEAILKIACLILAALMVYQLAGIVIRWNPFHGVTVPALPSLTASTNSPSEIGHRTNSLASATIKGTNGAQHLLGTNTASSIIIPNTNSSSLQMSAEKPANSVAHAELAKTETNVVARLETKSSGTNFAVSTNLVNQGTIFSISTNAAGTNTALRPKPEMKIAKVAPVSEMAGMNFNPLSPPGKRGGDLSPAVQTRINRIVDSEILGPVIHPLPMGLLGIAGEFAFLRSANGQTGLVKEGDSLGDLKLLRIGINRVLVEQDGQKNELMIFSGYGGESLLPKETTNENNHL